MLAQSVPTLRQPSTCAAGVPACNAETREPLGMPAAASIASRDDACRPIQSAVPASLSPRMVPVAGAIPWCQGGSRPLSALYHTALAMFLLGSLLGKSVALIEKAHLTLLNAVIVMWDRDNCRPISSAGADGLLP